MTNQQWLFFRSVLPHSWVDEFCAHVEKTYQAQDAKVGYDDEGVSLSQLPGRLPPPNHTFGPVILTIVNLINIKYVNL